MALRHRDNALISIHNRFAGAFSADGAYSAAEKGPVDKHTGLRRIPLRRATPSGRDVRRSRPVWLVVHLRRQNPFGLGALSGAVAALQLHAGHQEVRVGLVAGGGLRASR